MPIPRNSSSETPEIVEQVIPTSIAGEDFVLLPPEEAPEIVSGGFVPAEEDGSTDTVSQ